jgi:hypothetical protein
VSVHERIAKLEAILARVTQRAAAPREAPRDGAAHALAPTLVDEPVISSEPITPLDVEVSERTEEAPMVVAEVESRERIVAAPEVSAEPRADDAEPIPISVDTGERPVAVRGEEASDSPEITVSSESEVIEVGEEEPPASSRRPIALEPKLEELAFGEAPPAETVAHTPPPESGRQVAAAPVDLDFDGEFTGVRPREPEEVAVTVLGDVPKPKAEAPVMNLAPEATAAKLPGTAAVTFEGAAPVFKPATFGDLLDATLML